MADVFLATFDVSGVDKQVVVKRVLPRFVDSPKARTMLLDEARIGIQLRHQNIVQTLDAGVSEGVPFVALEYIEGVDLRRLLRHVERSGQRMSVALVAYIGAELMAALDYAHRASAADGTSLHLVHRDVTPENVLLSVEGEVKLSDFGIAWARSRVTRTETGGVKGKARYMAPEQLDAQPVDHRADLYSAAATMYESLGGEPPYASASEFEALRRLQQGDLTPLASLRADVPEEMRTSIEQALSPERERRPSEANAMSRAFENHLGRRGDVKRELAELVRAAMVERATAQAANARLENLLVAGDSSWTTDSSATSVEVPSGPHSKIKARKRNTWLAVLGVASALAVLGLRLATPGGGPMSTDAGPGALRPAAAVIQAPDGAPAVVSTPAAPRRDAGARGQRRPQAHGRLDVNAVPWARVEVDGKYVGDTPVRGLRLGAGKHRVRLYNPKVKRSANRTVNIQSGKASSLRVEL